MEKKIKLMITPTLFGHGPESTLTYIRTKATEWQQTAAINRLLAIGLGTIAILSSLFITSFAGSDWFVPSAVKGVSFLSAVSLAIISSFGIQAKSSKAKEAHRIIIHSLMLYENGTGTINDVIEAFGKADVIMGNVDFDFQSIRKNT